MKFVAVSSAISSIISCWQWRKGLASSLKKIEQTSLEWYAKVKSRAGLLSAAVAYFNKSSSGKEKTDSEPKPDAYNIYNNKYLLIIIYIII